MTLGDFSTVKSDYQSQVVTVLKYNATQACGLLSYTRLRKIYEKKRPLCDREPNITRVTVLNTPPFFVYDYKESGCVHKNLSDVFYFRPR